jgi:hypothetical protein
MKVLKDFILVVLVAFCLGLLMISLMSLAIWVYSLIFAPLTVDAKEISGKAVTINLCELIESGAVKPLTPVSCLEVVNNYGVQKTANINVLEPKVSDVYLQYGVNQ